MKQSASSKIQRKVACALALLTAFALLLSACGGSTQGAATTTAAAAAETTAAATTAAAADSTAAATEAATTAAAAAAETTAAATEAETTAAAAEETTEAAPVATDVEVSDDYVVVQLDMEIVTADPQDSADAGPIEILTHTLEGLYRTDAKGVPQLAQAESVDVSADGLTHTYKLRDGLVWSNGAPCTANDYVYAWRRLVDPVNAGTASYAFLMETVCIVNAGEVIRGEKPVTELGVTALDDKTLEVKFSVPVPFAPSLFTFLPFLPMNEEFSEPLGANYGTSPETTLANGPFVVTEYELNAMVVVLQKNPAYRLADQVSIPGIKYQIVKDAQLAALSFEAGDLDVVRLTGEQIEIYRDDPAFQISQTCSTWYFSINQDAATAPAGAALQNKNLRYALGLSFDREGLCNVLNNGAAPNYYMVPWQLAVDANGVDFREGAGEWFKTDKARALEYWETAKSELGISNIELGLLITDRDWESQIAQFMQAQIEEALPGVKLNIVVMPRKAKGDTQRDGNYDLALHGWGPDYADPLTFLELWKTSNTGSHSYGYWNNPEYDALVNNITAGELTLDVDARWEAMHEAEAMLMDTGITIPVFIDGRVRLVNTKLSNYVIRDTVGGSDYTYCVKTK